MTSRPNNEGYTLAQSFNVESMGSYNFFFWIWVWDTVEKQYINETIY